MTKKKDCPDCGAQIGDLHDPSCDVARCQVCGGQRLSCDHSNDNLWEGEWPGLAECRQYGLWCIRNPDGIGYIPCKKGTPGATEDLNRLGPPEFFWNQARQLWQPWTRSPEQDIMIEEIARAKNLIVNGQVTLIYNMSLCFFWGALQSQLDNPKVCEKLCELTGSSSINDFRAWFDGYYQKIAIISNPPFTEDETTFNK